MPRQKCVFRFIFALALLLLPALVLRPKLLTGKRDASGSIDYFEMSLEELMTIEVASADEPDVSPATEFV